MRSTPSTCIVSSILAVALAAAPTHVALAAAEVGPAAGADDDAEPADADDPAEPDDGVEEEADADAVEPADDGDGEEQEEDEEEAEDEPEPADEGEDEEAESAQPPTPAELVPGPEDERPEEPLIAGKPRKGKGLMIAGGAVLGFGIVSTAVFGAVSLHCSYDGPLGCRHRNDADFLVPLGASITLLGAMMLAVGVGYHFHYKKWERWTPEDAQKKKPQRRPRRGKTAVVPALGPGSAGLSWSGRF